MVKRAQEILSADVRVPGQFIFHQSLERGFPFGAVRGLAGIPLGSSQIEIRAAERLASDTIKMLRALEMSPPDAGDLQARLQQIIRLVKEGHRHERLLLQDKEWAEQSVEAHLLEQETSILESARSKFRHGNRVTDQWKTLKLLIGGGGADAPLYQRAVNQWFKQVSHFEPTRKPIPLPPDLKWPADLPPASYANAFRRFAVAYGLSFDRANLADHRFPKDVRPLPRRSDPSSSPPQAPTKDEC